MYDVILPAVLPEILEDMVEVLLRCKIFPAYDDL